MTRAALLRALMVALALPLGACGGNPAGSGGKPRCDHIDADGLVVERAGAGILHQWQGSVTGALTVQAGAIDTGLVATFFDADSQRIVVPAGCVDHELRWELGDTTLAVLSRSPTDRFAFSLSGRRAGSTQVRFRIWHGDHADFTSLGFPLEVTPGDVHEALPAQAVVLNHQCSWYATYNYPPTRGLSRATGPVVVTTGQLTLPFDADFYGADDSLLAVPASGYRVEAVIGDTTRVAARRGAGDAALSLRLLGRTPGATTLRVRLLYGDTIEYESGNIPVSVEPAEPAPTMAAPSFWLKKNGVRCVIVREGQQVASCGSSTADPGHLAARVGELTDLYTFQLLDGNCRASTPGQGIYSLVFDFADPCIAGTVRHPEHWDEIMLFHIVGLAAGETTVRIRLMKGTTLEAMSPPLRVVISPAGGTS